MARTSGNAKPRAKPKEVLPLMFTVPPGSDGLLTRYQIAALLSVGPTTFKQMLASGEYPGPDTYLGKKSAVAPGGSTRGKLPRWRVATHNAWIAARCSKPKV